MTIRAFIEARLAEDEQWARAASQPYKYASAHAKPPEGGVHWTWVVGENWTPVTADPVVDDTVGGVEQNGCTVNLASVEEWPTDASDHGRPVRTMRRTVANSMVEVDSSAAGHIARHDPARVLREVAAKRALLQQFVLRGNSVRATVQPSTGGVWDDLLRMLAAPYDDHPDCRSEWRIDG